MSTQRLPDGSRVNAIIEPLSAQRRYDERSALRTRRMTSPT